MKGLENKRYFLRDFEVQVLVSDQDTVQTFLLGSFWPLTTLWKSEGVIWYLCFSSLAEAGIVYFYFGSKNSLNAFHFSVARAESTTSPSNMSRMTQ